MNHISKTTMSLFAAFMICMTGCSHASENVASGEAASNGEMPIISTLTENGWDFNQVAMGGGGYVSGVFATSQEGLYYARRMSG